MIRKNRLCIILLVMVFMFASANAEGLFPSMDEMFGTAMPSVGLAIGRTADEQSDTDAGEQETYLNFGGEDYIAFGEYLAGIGASVKEYTSEDSTVSATISVRGAEMVFTYDWANRTAIAEYPSGTRAETEQEKVDKGDSILPPVGGVMPSAEFAIGRKSDTQSVGEEGLTLTWGTFSDDDYTAFSTYLAETGAVLKDSSIEAGVLNAELALNGFSFRFVYNWNKQSADVIYPEGTTPESSRWNSPVGSGNVLPEIKDLGRELPRISVALEREPSSTEDLSDGGIRETYDDFSEADYNTFSQYLQKTGCTLVDYHTDDSGVMVINLTNGSGKLVFSYDALRHTGIAEYPVYTRVERAWAPMPTPKPVTTYEPNTTVYTAKYSESDCWWTAYTYFKNLSWKNPQSLTIHNHTTSYTSDGYVFTIDYSAQNGFGGMNRGYYWITVDSSTGRVTSAFGSD